MDNSDNQKKLVSYYKSVFNTKEGEIVLADLMATHFWTEMTLVPGAPDISNFNLGQREVVRRVLELLRADPEELIKKTRDMEANHV